MKTGIVDCKAKLKLYKTIIRHFICNSTAAKHWSSTRQDGNILIKLFDPVYNYVLYGERINHELSHLVTQLIW